MAMRRFPAVVTAALLALLIPVRPFRGFVAPGTVKALLPEDLSRRHVKQRL